MWHVKTSPFSHVLCELHDLKLFIYNVILKIIFYDQSIPSQNLLLKIERYST